MNNADNSQATGQESFFVPFFKRLNEENIHYSVIHSYDSLPEHTDNDVDIALQGIKLHEAELILCKLADEICWDVVQKLWYDVPECVFYVICSRSIPRSWVKLDFLIDKNGIGYTLLSSHILTSEPVFNGLLKHSNPSIEFSYKLTKRIWKGYFKDEDREILAHLFAKADIDIVRTLLSTQYGPDYSDELIELFRNTAFTGNLDQLELYSRRQKERRNSAPIGYLLQLRYWQARRVLNRITRPTGIILLIRSHTEEEVRALQVYLTKFIGDAFRSTINMTSPSLLARFRALSSSQLLLCKLVDGTTNAGVYIQTNVFQPVSFMSFITKSPNHNNDSYHLQLTTAILKILGARSMKRICK